MLAARYQEEQAVESSKSAFASAFLDGTRVTVRLVRQSDVPLIEEMHRRLSQASIQFRYLSTRAPDPAYLQRLCFLDGQPGLAMVATVQEPREKVIGVACYGIDPRDPTTAEPAILVEDGYQGRGVGKHLALALGRQARQKGLKRFTCFIQLDNGRVLRLIRGSGLRYESRCSQGLREMLVWLESMDADGLVREAAMSRGAQRCG